MDQAIFVLLANPYTTTARAARFLGISFQGAAYAIKRLVDAEILRQAPHVGPAKLYFSRDVLEVLEAAIPQ